MKDKKEENKVDEEKELNKSENKSEELNEEELEKELKEVQDKYNKLLVFGVSYNNEKLKGTKC